MRFHTTLKRDVVVGAPFDGAKQRPRPASAQGNFRPLGGHPSPLEGVSFEVSGAKQHVRVLDDAGVQPKTGAERRRHVSVQKKRPSALTPMVGFLAHPNGNRRRHRPGHGAFKPVHRGDGGRQQAGSAEAVHGPVPTDFVGQREAQRKTPSCGRQVPMASPIPGPFSPQADGGGLRAEFAGHLLGLAQDLKPRKGIF